MLCAKLFSVLLLLIKKDIMIFVSNFSIDCVVLPIASLSDIQGNLHQNNNNILLINDLKPVRTSQK